MIGKKNSYTNIAASNRVNTESKICFFIKPCGNIIFSDSTEIEIIRGFLSEDNTIILITIVEIMELYVDLKRKCNIIFTLNKMNVNSFEQCASIISLKSRLEWYYEELDLIGLEFHW